MGGVAPHISEGFPGPPGPARPQNRTPQKSGQIAFRYPAEVKDVYRSAEMAGAMDVTNPHKSTGCGAMDVTKHYEFMGFGDMDVTKPYEFTGFGDMDVTKPYKSIGFGPPRRPEA